jgi:hypothetical protein
MNGGNELVERLEREGYDRIREEVARPCLTRCPQGGSSTRNGATAASPRDRARKPGSPPRGDAEPRARRRRRRRGTALRWRSCASARAPPTSPRAAALAALGLLADLLPGPGPRRAGADRRSAPDATLPEILADARAPARAARAARRLRRARGARPRARGARRDPLLARAGRRRAHRALRALLPAAPAARPPQAGGRERRVLDRRRLPLRPAGPGRRGALPDRL